MKICGFEGLLVIIGKQMNEMRVFGIWKGLWVVSFMILWISFQESKDWSYFVEIFDCG